MIDLDVIVKDYKLFVDTCFLLHTKAKDVFYGVLPPILLRYGKKLILPHRVILEVGRLRNSEKENTKRNAINAYNIINEYINNNMLTIHGEPNDPFADNVFHYVFSKFKTQYNLCLLTQDSALSKDITDLGKLESINSSYQIKVLKIDNDGNVTAWKQIHSNYDKRFDKSLKEWQAIHRKPSSIKNSFIPTLKDKVYCDVFGEITLIEKIDSGGEGIIYLTSNNMACKIFFNGKLTNNKLDKLMLMCSKPVNIDGVCWPKELVKNEQGEIVGYIMPRAQGIPMQKCMFVKPLLKKYFPNWKREDLVSLAIVICRKIEELHKQNILIGDINPLNILIKTNNEIYLVDSDSYQIGSYPCAVGMVNYTAPEIQGKRFSEFLRTQHHELYAVATLIFMILLPGKPPYSHQGGGTPADNIKKANFSYPFGGKSNQKTPQGPWRFIWSNLPYMTKKAFYDCFHENKRPSINEWLDILAAYQQNIQNGWMSNELFPTSFKKINQYAQDTFGAEQNMEQLTCDNCQKEFDVLPSRIPKIMGYKQILCPNCIEHKKTTGDWLYCCECGDQFLFNLFEQDFFEEQGFEPPIRCKRCRNSK